MIDFIRRLQESKAVKMDYPNIFDESNVISLFGILDPSSKGVISHEKYLKGSISFQFLQFLSLVIARKCKMHCTCNNILSVQHPQAHLQFY